MAKIFLLVIVLLVVFWWFITQRNKPTDPGSQQSSAHASERIVVCAQCQLHVPESESICHEGRHYCCDEHRQRGPV
jgi:hypothetical protein